nr:branched-chain amino acid ABC transporter permease [Phreatobacter stygius]
MAIAGAIALGLPWLAAAVGDPALVPLGARILVAAIAAASLNLLVGQGGLVSFGHAAFFGVGGYVVAILYEQTASGERLFGLLPGAGDLLLTIPAAILFGGLTAAAIGALALRTRGVQFIMITLAFAQMLFFVMVSLKAYGGEDGLLVRRRNTLGGHDMRDDDAIYFLCLACFSAHLFLTARVVGSRFGRVLEGVRQNERRLAAIGIATYRYKLTAFIIAGMGAGLAGALSANLTRFVSPDMLHWTKSGELLIMVILGGTGALAGPLVGAAAFIGLETLFSGWTEHWQPLLGAVILGIVLASRRGLGGWLPRGKATS